MDFLPGLQSVLQLLIRGMPAPALAEYTSKSKRTSHTFNLIIFMFSDPILSVCEGEPDAVFLRTALSGVLINIKKFERITRRSEVSKVYFAKTAKTFCILRLKKTF